MRILRITFVSLIAVGICGGLYIGLTTGLAAYLRFKSNQLAASDAPASATTDDARPAGSKPRPPSVETAAELLERTWTAPRYGLTTTPPMATRPNSAVGAPIAVAHRTWLAPTSLTATPRLLILDGTRPLRMRPIVDAISPMPVLLLADAPAIKLPTAPPASVAGPDPDRIRIAPMAAYRDGDRPALLADPTLLADEQQLMSALAPMRTTPAPFEKLVIPDPTPNSAGEVRTPVGDTDAPTASPDRPEAIKFPVK